MLKVIRKLSINFVGNITAGDIEINQCSLKSYEGIDVPYSSRDGCLEQIFVQCSHSNPASGWLPPKGCHN
jgi:hypothetical protein